VRPHRPKPPFISQFSSHLTSLLISLHFNLLISLHFKSMFMLRSTSGWAIMYLTKQDLVSVPVGVGIGTGTAGAPVTLPPDGSTGTGDVERFEKIALADCRIIAWEAVGDELASTIG
jgi:hypothetical protein